MSEIRIEARLDTTKLEEEEAQWRLRLRQLNRDISQTKLELRRTQLYAVTVLGSIMGIASTIVSFLPEPFRLIGQAAVNVVTTTISSLTAVAMAYTAGGPLLWFQALMAGFAVAVAVMGLGTAIMNQQRLDSEVTRFTSGMTSLSNQLSNVMRSLGV